MVNIVFLCRVSFHQLQPEQQYPTTIPHTKSTLFIAPLATHLCRLHLKHANATPASHRHRARQSQKPAGKVTSTTVPLHHFQSGVAGRHGYTCNLMLRDLLSCPCVLSHRRLSFHPPLHLLHSPSLHAGSPVLSLVRPQRSSLR